jgi:hypothetical protein
VTFSPLSLAFFWKRIGNISSPFNQVLLRLSVRISTEPRQMVFDFLFSAHQNPVRIPPSRPQDFLRKEFNDQLWDVFSTLDKVNWISTQDSLQGYPRSVTSIICSFHSCLKVTFLYLPTSIGNHLIKVFSDTPMFTNVVYGL